MIPNEDNVKCDNKFFSKEQLQEFIEVQTWLRTVSPHSSKIYLNALKDFCNWCRKSPKELILERDREKDDPDPNKRTGIKNLILDFRKHLEKQGYAPKTINSRDGAIRSFFSAVLGTSGQKAVSLSDPEARFMENKKKRKEFYRTTLK